MSEKIAIRVSMASGQVLLRPVSFLGPVAFQRYLEASRAAGARYDPSVKAQTAPSACLPQIVDALSRSGYDVAVEEDLRRTLDAEVSAATARADAAVAAAKAVAAEAVARGQTLYPFQAVGVAWLRSRRRALLADEMGLGKTVQALMAFPENAAAVVICPASVKSVWSRECARWREDLTPVVLSGRGSFRWPLNGELVIANYDILPETVGAPSCVTALVMDEAHAAKNAAAARTKRARAISDAVNAGCGSTWLLTGTPLMNRPQELWAVLEAAAMGAEAFGSKKGFLRAFQARLVRIPGKDRGMTYEYGAATPSVAESLQRVMLRRRRAEVLPDLPGKTREILRVEIAAYVRQKLDAFAAELAAAGVSVEQIVAQANLADHQRQLIFERLSEIRAALAAAKVPALLACVEEHEEQEEPLVVFSAHRLPVDALAARAGWAVITGDTENEARARIVEDFQAGRLKGVALTIAAGGVGLTLTHSHKVVFVDQAWTPALNAQAEDRVCRIGQDRGVIVTILAADHPIDWRVAELLAEKQALIESTVERAAVEGAEIESAARATESVAMERASAAAAIVKVAVADPVKKLEVSCALGTTKIPAVGATIFNGLAKRGPHSPEERHAAAALVLLADLDPDHAQARNGAGFNLSDGEFGHSLASQIRKYGRLSEKQWAAGVSLVQKYYRQVGTA